MAEEKISFTDFFKLDDPSRVKVKFNMVSGRGGKKAWENLLEEDLSDAWINMNAYRTKHANNNLDRAKYLLSFAQYSTYGAKYYVFGGLYKVEKVVPEVTGAVGYKLELQPQYKEYRKRLIIKLKEPVGRDLYTRWYEKVQEQLKPEIYEITPSTALGNFPGYNKVCITNNQLQTIFREEAPEWKQALSVVKGVYCITDKSTGQLYIGSAYGDNEGIWQRWSNYANPNKLTGGNKTFDEYMKKNGADYIIDNFTYTILEIFDMRTKGGDIIDREEYWKKVFRSVEFGMNNNKTKKQK